MDARRESEPIPMKNRTTVERKSERELVIARTFNGLARIVFEAWTKPGAVTAVAFEEKGGQTLVVVRELHSSKEALDGARASGVEAGTLEAFEQLDELLGALGASEGQ
jgi:uncharacterized protein YndB with AHSA1/START domain